MNKNQTGIVYVAQATQHNLGAAAKYGPIRYLCTMPLAQLKIARRKHGLPQVAQGDNDEH